MPPKVKIYKSTGKSQLKNNVHSPQSISMTPEQEQQFQVELYWCIQQLQTALGNGKLNNKQVEDHTKALNTLMSNSSTVVQKRQVMRLSFGNYREKIAAEEERASKNIAKIKLKPAVPNNKSMFVKKAMSLTNGNHNFKFNFDVPIEKNETASSNIVDEEMLALKNVSNIKQDNKCHYVSSDNSFRFNFDVDRTL